jgi:hypothetical protein
MCFDQRFEQEHRAKFGIFMAPMNCKNCSWPSFSPFYAHNLECHPKAKLCSTKNWTTFILRDFEVFRWNLENATKVSEGVQRHRGLGRVWPCLWPRFDHKHVLTWSRGSLGFISEIFEVMTQVWPTSVGFTPLIQSLALMTIIKNLGRHTYRSHSRQVFGMFKSLTSTYYSVETDPIALTTWASPFNHILWFQHKNPISRE